MLNFGKLAPAMIFVVSLVVPGGAIAQHSKIPKVGFLAFAKFVPPKLFSEELQKQGFVDGQNVSIEYHFADGRHDQMRSLAANMVRSGVDVILANGDQAVVAAMAETKTVPIVMLSCDALAMGFVQSLSRPGGNVTGVTCISVELSPKRVAVFKELIPRLSNLAVIYNPENVAKPADAASTITAAGKIGVQGQRFEVRDTNDIERAFRTIGANGTDGLIVLSEALTLIHRKLITDLSLKYRLPDMHVYREFPDAGGLVSYGPNVQEMLRQTARHLAKILKGEKPGDLPVEQPTNFDFVVNQTRARVLGLQIPTSILTQATAVIE